MLNIGIELYIEKIFCVMGEKNLFPALSLFSMDIVVITAIEWHVNSKNGHTKIYILITYCAQHSGNATIGLKFK